MGCRGCPGGSSKSPTMDKRGNIKEGQAELSNRPEEQFKPKDLPPDLKNMTYEKYVLEKKAAREYGDKIGAEHVETFSMDYKRIQIQELIDVVNHLDGGPLSPTQALQALFDFSNMSVYKKVFDEFPGLKSRVNELYNKLILDNKIIVEWSP